MSTVSDVVTGTRLDNSPSRTESRSFDRENSFAFPKSIRKTLPVANSKRTFWGVMSPCRMPFTWQWWTAKSSWRKMNFATRSLSPPWPCLLTNVSRSVDELSGRWRAIMTILAPSSSKILPSKNLMTFGQSSPARCVKAHSWGRSTPPTFWEKMKTNSRKKQNLRDNQQGESFAAKFSTDIVQPL